ncbi:MAG TPA: hypothetical protein VM778_15295 [Gemmatimonadota bacterium]|nr:hypothetical protein [Gemmatimonadota bacterium]
MHPVRPLLSLGVALTVALAFACDSDSPAGAPTGSVDLALSGGPVIESASGGYHFTTDPRFFGVPVDNRLTFSAQRHADGSLSGRFNYEQGVLGERFIFRGRVTCFEIYDTPVLQDWPDIPAMTGNRAKWGGVVEFSNDPTLPAGVFTWFQSIDNGEGANAPPDLSTISGFGDEAANEAFCNVATVPNPNFGPHPVEGNIQVRP